MTRAEFKPKGIIDYILGKPVWDMCQILDEKIPWETEDGNTIKGGIMRMSYIDVLFGVGIGISFGFFLFGGFMIFWGFNH